MQLQRQHPQAPVNAYGMMRRWRCERGVGACPLATSLPPQHHSRCRLRGCRLAWLEGPHPGRPPALHPCFGPEKKMRTLLPSPVLCSTYPLLAPTGAMPPAACNLTAAPYVCCAPRVRRQYWRCRSASGWRRAAGSLQPCTTALVLSSDPTCALPCSQQLQQTRWKPASPSHNLLQAPSAAAAGTGSRRPGSHMRGYKGRPPR